MISVGSYLKSVLGDTVSKTPGNPSCHRHRYRLLAATQTQHQVQGRLLLDVVVRKGAAVFELLSGEDQALLVRWDTLLVLDL